jgi:hypothetical protein
VLGNEIGRNLRRVKANPRCFGSGLGTATWIASRDTWGQNDTFAAASVRRTAFG